MSEKPVRYIVDKKGKRTGVFLSYMQYRRLLEDLHDLKMLAERRGERPISLKETRRRLRRAGRV